MTHAQETQETGEARTGEEGATDGRGESHEERRKGSPVTAPAAMFEYSLDGTAASIEEWLPDTDIELASLVDDPTVTEDDADGSDAGGEEGRTTSDAGNELDFEQLYPSEDGAAVSADEGADSTNASRCSCRRAFLFACVLCFVIPALVLVSKSGALSISQISSNGRVSTDGPIAAAPSSSRQVKAGRLVAITNEEGITAQKVTLESFMRLAYETRRNLLLIPFQSAHYKDPIGHRVFVRLEDYIDNATESLDWHTLDPYERVDESLLEMISDPVNNCIRGNYVQNGYATISINSTTDNPDYYKAQYPKSTGQSQPEPTPSLRSIAEEIDLKRNESDACVAGRIWTIEPQFRKNFPLNLNPSSPVIDLAERGIRNLLSKPNDSGNLTSIVTLHLRRGDKCFKDPLSVACAFVDKLPFLELCESMWKDGIGMYVSTNENSPSVLQKLRDRKCLLAEDLKMNFVEEAKRLNSRSPDAWNSYHPDALQFSTEAYLLMNANETYSMGCSSLLSEMMRYRSGAHLSPAKIYSAVHGEFDHLKNWGEQHCPQQQ